MPYKFYSKDSLEYANHPNDVDTEEHFGGVQICYCKFIYLIVRSLSI